MPRVILCFHVVFAFGVSLVSAQEATLIVENARVIIGDGTVLERGTVVVSGDRIISVGAEQVEATGARRIDASGGTVLPGLIDTHVHLLMEHLFEQPRSDSALYEFMEARLPARLQAYTDAGITTVMSAGDFWPFINDVSERIQSGDLTGPRVYAAGPLFTAQGGHPAATFCGSMDMHGPNPWCREHLTEEVVTSEDVRAAVARLNRDGVNQIKFVYEGPSEADVKSLKANLVGEIIDAAHEQGLRTYAHILELPLAIEAIESGLDGLVHLPAVSSQPDETGRLVQLMLAEGVAASTTLTTFDSMMEIAAEQGDDGLSQIMSGLLDGMKQTLAQLAEMNEGLVVLGTDAPHLPPAGAFYREIELMAETGLAPERIIQAATRDAAKYVGLGDELGTLEPGMLADLIVVDGNPLSDLSVLQEIRSVVKGGEIVAPIN